MCLNHQKQPSIQSLHIYARIAPSERSPFHNQQILSWWMQEPDDKISFTCPLVLVGEAAASPGFSAAVSAFPVLDNCAPMLFTPTKKLNRSKKRTKTPQASLLKLKLFGAVLLCVHEEKVHREKIVQSPVKSVQDFSK